MIHSSVGFPVLGRTKIDGAWPDKSPVVFFEDFFAVGYGEFSGTTYATKYKVAGTNPEVIPQASNTGAVQTPVVDGGVLRLTTCSTSGDSLVFAVGSTGFATAAYSDTDPKPIIYSCRARPVTSVASVTHAFGVTTAAGHNSTTELVTSETLGVKFVVTNGALQYAHKYDSTAVAATALTDPDTGVAITLAAGVFHTFTIIYDGKNTHEMWYDGKLVKTIVWPTTFTAQVWLPAQGVKCTTGAGKILDIDKLYFGYQTTKAGR